MYTYIPMYTYVYTRQYPMIIIQLGRGGGKKMAEGRGWQSFSASSDKQSCKYPVGAARVERYKRGGSDERAGEVKLLPRVITALQSLLLIGRCRSLEKRQLSASFKVTIRQLFVLCLIKSLTINFKGKVKAVFCVFFFFFKVLFFFVGFFSHFFFLCSHLLLKFSLSQSEVTIKQKQIKIYIYL